eukprot:2902195-Amphidinium_carterae.3
MSAIMVCIWLREVMLARGAVAMEVVCVLALLPRVCGSRRGVTSTLVCCSALQEQQEQKQVQVLIMCCCVQFLLFPCGLLVPWGKTAPDPKDAHLMLSELCSWGIPDS